MAWDHSTRRARLPGNWQKLRREILSTANHQCQGLAPTQAPPPSTPPWRAGTFAPDGRWHAAACDRHATDVDHVVAGDDHSPSNLQALSLPCHRAKTARERQEQAARMAAMRRRTPEPHPCQATAQHTSVTQII